MKQKVPQDIRWRQYCSRILVPEEIITTLKEKPRIAILATFSDQGIPHTSPIQFIYPINEESFLIAINKFRQGYRNMVWQKKVSLSFLEKDIAYNIACRAGVILAPSMTHPIINIVRLDIIKVKKASSLLINIDKGVQYSYASDYAQEVSEAIWEELKFLSKRI